MPAYSAFAPVRHAASRAASIVLALVLGACAFGPSVGSFKPAQQADGVSVRLAGRDGIDVRGELVAISDTAAIVRDASRLTLVPWRRVDYLWVDQYGEYRTGRRMPNLQLAEQLRRVSRFPQGLTPDLERALLGAVGLPALEVIR